MSELYYIDCQECGSGWWLTDIPAQLLAICAENGSVMLG